MREQRLAQEAVIMTLVIARTSPWNFRSEIQRIKRFAIGQQESRTLFFNDLS